MMKKVIIFIVALFGFVSFSLAANQPNVGEAMTQQNVGSFYPIEACFDGQTVYQTQNHYVGDDFYLYDTHWGDYQNYAYVYDRATKVFLVDPYGVFDFDDSFRFKSNGKPTGVYKVKFVENNGDFLPGTLSSGNPDVNNGELVAQIVFNLHRQWFHTNGGPAGYSIDYWPMPNGPQSTTSFNNYYVGNYNADGLECYNYVVHYCGDGDVDTAQSIAALEGGNPNSVANEQCDPADPTEQGWGTQGCSNICQPINQTIDPPTCTLSHTFIGNGNYLIHWNINGSFYNPTYIYITPDTVVEASHLVVASNGTWNHVDTQAPGNYTASLSVSNDGGSNTCQTSFTVSGPTAICGDGNIDLPNDNGFNEQCDDGNNINTDGCKNDCTLNTPNCTLYANPQIQNLGSLVELIATKSSWARYLTLNLDDGTVIENFGMPYSHMYNFVGTFNPVLTVQNNYSPIANGVVRPIITCDTNVEIIQELPDLDVDKILLTTNPVGIGDFVDYKIELTNNGQGVSTNTYLRDEMPASLELVSYNIVGISDFEVNDWQDTNGNWFVEYSGFDLSPGQTAVMTLRGKVRNGALAGQTTNCAFTIGDYDCEMYSLSNNPYIIKYQKNASANNSSSLMSIKDIVFVNEAENAFHNAAQTDDPEFGINLYTTGNIVVNFGDIIKYKIKFGNNGATYTNGGVRVVDHMPKCVDYVTASIHGIDDANFVQTQDINGRRILEYNGFDLDAGQQGYMLIEGKVMNTPECQNITTYINNAYIYFVNPLRVLQSNTTALRQEGVANVYKDSDIDVHMPNDDKRFNIWVTNRSQNPISNIILEDVWPSGPCIEYVDRSGIGFEKDPTSLIWTYDGPLAAGKSIVMYIDAHILNDSSCVKPDYENIVKLIYTEAGSEKYDQANYYFSVIGSPVSNVSLTKTADKAVVSSGDVITYTIVYQNNGTVALNSYVLTDIWPAMVGFRTATPFPNSVLNLTTGSILKWIFNTPLLPGEGGEIILEGIVK